MAQISVNMGDGNFHSGDVIPKSIFDANQFKSLMDVYIRRTVLGSLHYSRIIDIKMCAPSDSTASEIGLWKQKSFGSGGVVRVERIRLSCFAPGIRVWARHI